MINHDCKISNDIIENIIVVLQILHSFQCLNFNDLNIAIANLSNSKTLSFNFQDETLKYIENDIFPLPKEKILKKNVKYNFLKMKIMILKITSV